MGSWWWTWPPRVTAGLPSAPLGRITCCYSGRHQACQRPTLGGRSRRPGSLPAGPRLMQAQRPRKIDYYWSRTLVPTPPVCHRARAHRYGRRPPPQAAAVAAEEVGVAQRRGVLSAPAALVPMSPPPTLPPLPKEETEEEGGRPFNHPSHPLRRRPCSRWRSLSWKGAHARRRGCRRQRWTPPSMPRILERN